MVAARFELCICPNTLSSLMRAANCEGVPLVLQPQQLSLLGLSLLGVDNDLRQCRNWWSQDLFQLHTRPFVPLTEETLLSEGSLWAKCNTVVIPCLHWQCFCRTSSCLLEQGLEDSQGQIIAADSKVHWNLLLL